MLDMSDRLTAAERAAIEGFTGEVQRIPTRRPRLDAPRSGAESSRQPASKAPKGGRSLPAQMGVWDALKWAFGTECAQMDADEMRAVSGDDRRGMSAEAVLAERHALGNVRIDRFPGRSEPAEEAQIIASVTRAALRWHEAVWIADLARAGREPDAMVGVVPRLIPVAWHGNRHGWHGKAADSADLVDGWKPTSRRNRKGVLVRDVVRYTPCTWSPSASQIGAARRQWLDWWGHLLTLQVAIRAAGLRRFRLTDAMPPMSPWKSY